MKPFLRLYEKSAQGLMALGNNRSRPRFLHLQQAESFDPKQAKKLFERMLTHYSVKRLAHVKQHGCRAHIRINFSVSTPEEKECIQNAWGNVDWDLNYNRHEHVVFILDQARLFCEARGIPPHDAFALEVAAVLHDTGHLALSHTGEHFVRELLKPMQTHFLLLGEEHFDNHFPDIVSHEERSLNILRKILFSAPDPVGFDRHKMFQTCAWLVHPKQHARPLHTSFSSNPFSASTHDDMDLDRCYLQMDAPPRLRQKTASAVHAWLTHDCEPAQAYLMRLRSLLHEHIYPAISRATQARVALKLEKAKPHEKAYVLSHLLRDATCESAPFLTDRDILKDDEITISLPPHVRSAFMNLE